MALRVQEIGTGVTTWGSYGQQIVIAVELTSTWYTRYRTCIDNY